MKVARCRNTPLIVITDLDVVDCDDQATATDAFALPEQRGFADRGVLFILPHEAGPT